VNGLRTELRAAYQQAAAQAIARGDWPKAKPCLAHAVDLGAADKQTLARLAYAGERFDEAAKLAPDWPDPHVALARLHLSKPDEAWAEMQKAEQLGYKPTAKDTRPIAEEFRARGFEELEAGNTAAAQRDFERARSVSANIEIPDLRPPAPSRKPRSRRWH
jgi:hypothetical protein